MAPDCLKEFHFGMAHLKLITAGLTKRATSPRRGIDLFQLARRLDENGIQYSPLENSKIRTIYVNARVHIFLSIKR